MKETETQDLQVFIGQVPADAQFAIEGVPSLAVPHGIRGGTRTLSPDLEVESPRKLERNSRYITVANSDVVEVADFSGLGAMIEFSKRLNHDEVRLQECISIGGLLFDVVFQRATRDMFRTLYAEEGDLRVTIATSSPELAVLPWELMCDTQPGLLPTFLCHQNDLHLVRSLRVFNRSKFRVLTLGDGVGEAPGERELRILLITASAPGMPYINVEKEEKMLRFVLDEPPALKQVRINVLHQANVESLGVALREYRPHVVHIACHGDYNKKEDLGHIVLLSAADPDKFDFVNSYRFATLLEESDCLQFVFANTCYGAFQSEASAFSGVAQCLHAIGVPAVVALQFVLTDRTAHAIVLNFYKYLLRDGLSVEAAVTRVRRNLFISGNMFQETFGLALYQANSTLFWPKHTLAERLTSMEPSGFKALEDFFDQKTRNVALERLSLLFERTREDLRDLERLTSEDLLLAFKLFDGLNFAFRLLRNVGARGVAPAVFLKFLGLAKALAMGRLERESVATTFVLKTEVAAKAYQQQFEIEDGEPLDKDLFAITGKEVLAFAKRVNGEDRVFLAKITGDSATVTLQNLKSPKIQVNENDCPGIEPKWWLVCHNVKESGCALILPGDGRLKIVIGGEQAAEFSKGVWRQSSQAEIREGFVKLAQNLSLPEEHMLSFMRVALAASEREQGFSLIIQRDKPLVPSKCQPGFCNVRSSPDTLGIRNRTVSQVGERDYIRLLDGDNAVIVSKEGVTLAYNVSLAVSNETPIQPVPGSGSRHLSAQRISQETDAVAIVVSEDGPISVFVQGERVLYY